MPGQTHQATINVPRTNQLLLSHAKQRASLNTSPREKLIAARLDLFTWNDVGSHLVAQTSGICMVPGVRHHRHRHIRHNNPNAHQASLFRFSGRPTLFHQTGHPAHLHSTRHGGPGRHV
ncbi:hypothetical protein BASA60_007428 [Batrachochytrium salamandrivorans]|nr:hypothetical protein BASA60_007428 [Batrachochytrium salamandrivorans]